MPENAPSSPQHPYKSDWAKRLEFDWSSAEGIDRLRRLVKDYVKYEPAPFQLENTARLLKGQDVLCVSATGDGKTALLYMYAMARRETVTIVISPTNALEKDMVRTLSELGIASVAINSETSAAAETEVPSRNLWDEVKALRYRMVFVAPETLKGNTFRSVIMHPNIRPVLGLLGVDECHLVDEWGKDFRKDYGNIRLVRPWLPPWTSVVALTATLEPGRQTEAVVRAIGLRPNDYHFEKRDCERHNVDIVIRPIMYTTSTRDFPDLNWLIERIQSIQDSAKTLLYSDTIEIALRVARYLRSLLPPHLRKNDRNVIRLIHSLACELCKQEALDSLYQDGTARTTAIHVTTDILGVGMNMSDFDDIVCFPTPSTAAALIQRSGRAARGRGRHGTAYIYIKKSDMESVTAALIHDTDLLLDTRLLAAPLTATSPRLLIAAPAADTAGKPAKSRTTKVIPAKAAAPSKKLCPSLRLIIAAHIRGACITRQINLIYQNPNTTDNCGRCSSCLPRPCSTIDSTSSPDQTLPSPHSSTTTMTSESTSKASAPADKTPAYMKLTLKDMPVVNSKLEDAALLTQISQPSRPEFFCIGPTSFLPAPLMQRITHNFHLLSSKEELHQRLADWSYWNDYGAALWHEIKKVRAEMDEILADRHRESLQKRRQKAAENAHARVRDDEEEEEEDEEKDEVRDCLVTANLTGVKQVVLRVRDPLTGELLPLPAHSSRASASQLPKPILLDGENSRPPTSSSALSTTISFDHHSETQSQLMSSSSVTPPVPLLSSTITNSPSRKRVRDAVSEWKEHKRKRLG